MMVTKNHDSVRYQCRVPMFEVLAISNRVNGSKLAGWNEGNSPPKYNRRLKRVWMMELAARIVRRYKIPVAFAEQLEWKIQEKYGRSNTFNLPSPYCNIGLMTSERFGESWVVKATGMGHPLYGNDVSAVRYAALKRVDKLKVLMKKTKPPTGLALTAWIIQTELGDLLNGREKEARQQSWIRRQQGRSASQYGGNDWPVGAGDGAQHQQHH